GQNLAYKYGLALGVDACLPEHCMNRVQDGDETGPDCGSTCGSCACANVGSGQAQHCTVWCTCVKGDGDCSFNEQCATGLVCGAGVRWGKSYNVCQAAHCTNGVRDTASGETGVDCGGPDCGAVCP